MSSITMREGHIALESFAHLRGLRPCSRSDPMTTPVRRRDLLGGLIHEYEVAV